MSELKQHIFIIGFMGVGKSTVAKELGSRYRAKEADTDKMIVEKEGKAITDIFADSGEEYFRNVETGILDDLKNMQPGVVSCGGGMVMREINVKKMKEQGKILLLTARPETIYERVKDSTDRPILNGNMNVEYIEELMEARRPKYEAAADIVVATDGKMPGQIAEEIVAAFNDIE